MAEVTIHSSSADGLVTNLVPSGVWATVRSATSGTFSVNDHYRNSTALRARVSGGNTEIGRAFFYFDLSALPSNAIITSATLSLYKYGGTVKGVCAQEGTQADVLTVTDFDAFAGSELGHADWPYSDAYVAIPFNAAGCTFIEGKMGSMAKVCCREYSHDYLNSNPGGLDCYNGCYFFEDSGTSRSPKLVIVYTEIYTGYKSLKSSIAAMQTLYKDLKGEIKAGLTILKDVCVSIDQVAYEEFSFLGVEAKAGIVSYNNLKVNVAGKYSTKVVSVLVDIRGAEIKHSSLKTDIATAFLTNFSFIPTDIRGATTKHLSVLSEILVGKESLINLYSDIAVLDHYTNFLGLKTDTQAEYAPLFSWLLSEVAATFGTERISPVLWPETYPLNGQGGIGQYGPVYLRVYDSISGIDLDTIDLKVSGESYIYSSPEVTVIPVNPPYIYVIKFVPSVPWAAGSNQEVSLFIRDKKGNPGLVEVSV